MKPSLLYLIIGLLLVNIFACKTEIDLYASEEDIWVVYGILSLEDSIQYIRVSKAFQVQADAIEFAAENDVTVKNLNVSLTGPNGTITARRIDTIMREDGIFFPGQSIYQLETRGEDALLPNVRYQLSIRSDSLPDLFLTASTRIPSIPLIQRPSAGIRNDTIACLSRWNIEDSLEIIFSTRRAVDPPSGAYAFQVQADLMYQEDGLGKRAVFGPTRTFSESRGCAARSNNTRCYYIPRGIVLNAFENFLQANSDGYTYEGDKRCMPDPEDLPQPVIVKVSAIDTMLGRYLLANDPRYSNFNTIRIEYTNLEGSDRAVGIFGSTATAERAVVLSACAERRLYLNGQRPGPNDCD